MLLQQGEHILQAIYAGRVLPLNKVFGLRLEPIDERTLTAIEEQLLRRRTPVRIEISTLAYGAITAMLTRRGYAIVGFENVLGLELDAPCVGRLEQGDAAGSELRRVGKEELGARIEAVVRGFAHPDVHEGPAPTERSNGSAATLPRRSSWPGW